MAQSLYDKTDVLIVGAGPTGLMMACQLAVLQVSFRIIDKNTTSSQNSGALIVQARTLEILEQMGIAIEAIKQGIIADRVNILFDGKKIASASIKDIGRDLSQFPFLLMLEQSKTERLLLKLLEEHGRYVERNVQFIRFAEDKDTITTDVIMPDGSGKTILSKYLIAADGSKSAIRKFLNIPFKGITYSRPIFILDCAAISEFHKGDISFTFSKSSVAGFFPLVNQRWRVDGNFPKRVKNTTTITLETVTKGLDRMNFKLHDTEWFSVSHSQQKYAHTIRIGNCFLAGDAAHVNTPVGAQGMNTGLQDAFNLAWKLAYVIKHQAKPELLNTYSAERLGISKGFAGYADMVFKIVTSTNGFVKICRMQLMKLFFTVVFPLLEKRPSFRQKFFKSISQINIHYKPSFGSNKDSERLFLHGTTKPGYRLPFVDFIYDNKKTNSHQILNASAYTLLVLAEELTPELKSISEKYKLSAVLLKRLPETDKIYTSLGIASTGYYLIRPDMYVAFRSGSSETESLCSYLHQLLIEHQHIGLLPKNESACLQQVASLSLLNKN